MEVTGDLLPDGREEAVGPGHATLTSRYRRVVVPGTRVGRRSLPRMRTGCDQRSFQSGGAGRVGTAGDFMTFLECLRTGGAPILKRETVELASRNQVGSLREEYEPMPGWGFGYLSGVLIDPRAGRLTGPCGNVVLGRGLRAFVVPGSGRRGQRRWPDQHRLGRLHGLIPCRCADCHLRLTASGLEGAGMASVEVH